MRKDTYVVILLAMLGSLGLALQTPVDALAQTPAQLRFSSPAPGQSIDGDGLLVVLEVGNSIALDLESLELVLDGNIVEIEPKASATSIRYLILDALPGGAHTLFFSARTVDGRAVNAPQRRFVVDGARAFATKSPSPSRSLRGTTYIGTRNASFTGNRILRQEPEATYVVRSDLTARYGRFTFPIKAYLTTDESSAAQPRNRVMVGAESPWFSIYGGDTRPDFSPLTLAGARARGILAQVHLPGVRLSVARGQLRRAVDVISLTDPSQVASPFLNTYRRSLTAAELAVGNPKTVEFGLHAMKAADDTTSIAFGTRPMENLVAGSDFSVRALHGKLNFETGAALSITTEDISRGISDKAELDSLFEVDLPIDPADYGWLITLNPSTVPLRVDKLSSLAWYAGSRIQVAGHRVGAEYRSIGGAFYSAGNPFLINDRRSISITDRFRAVDDRLSGTLRFLHYGSQPDSHELAIPLSSTTYASNLSFRSGPRLPTLSAGFRYNTRSRGDEISMLSDSRLVSVSLGVIQQVRTRSQTHTIQVTASHTDKADRVNAQLDNTTTMIGAGLYEQLSPRVNGNVQVTLVSITYSGFDDTQRWTTVGAGLSKSFVAFPLRLSGQGRLAHASASTLLTGSNRYGGSLTGSYDLQSNMTIELQVGIDAFRDESIETARYTERFVSLRHRYTF